MKWSFPLEEEIRKVIIAELRKIVEEHPLPEYPRIDDMMDLCKHDYSHVILNEDKFYIGISEDKNVSE